jgi:hypothetical protein
VQLLFDLFDISIIPTGTGIGSLALPLRRAATSRPTNRFSHVTLLGGASPAPLSNWRYCSMYR